MRRIRIFISSVQSEFATDRAMLSEYIRTDALFARYFDPFLFEELPAQDVSAQKAYLDAAANTDIYLVLVGERYGYEDSEGVSPTEREYDTATLNGAYRLAFIKDVPCREAKEEAFKRKIEKDVTRNPVLFNSPENLRSDVYASLIHYLTIKGLLVSGPTDAAIQPLARIEDLDKDKVRWFVGMAREKRRFPLQYSEENLHTILSSLHLISDDDGVTNAALLLFAKDVQKWFPSATVKCAQFYGTQVEKPILSQQLYDGNVFDVVDLAVDFVLSRIDARVGERTASAQVDVSYELPVQAVTEAIVNAIVHRDYASNGSVQVMLFKDRLEVWNPGRLPHGVTITKLSSEHQSVPVNPLLARPVYLAGYIEQLGTGTTDLIRRCVDMGLRKPEFRQDEYFVSVLWRKKTGKSEVAGQVTGQVTGQVRGQVKETVRRLVLAIGGQTLTRKQIMELLSLKGRDNFRVSYLEPSIVDGYVSKLYPESDNRPDQAYYLTETGMELFSELRKEV